ncbi:MAG: tRNA (adenosine(37)-N6)-threonylcarbamoyltransferase complex ATPase subunit type 1 TsaE [Drouetiella hepatica Uher 2000/2452]|jgi:tRNA threonylcarbamoyladenosine biosynthesis protein TsaE|uniref:tRNA threonylcarbamoyladenosine biosynthesis protein TsaE n=1 Tax=Drouetiella hepatica Uher 2000/2452 TaxID=904376 RepID=A0A951QAK4_9CYAN|nr:tRNA (adenosine(37)-N6)-threonylcarbamoyltransferase complex ATPase subunit type 1 TsaE [Drouetiella hepatica Uher 2000/2452]
MQDLNITLPDPSATHSLGLALGQGLPAGSILLLKGELGSGKTSLVQGIGQGLGIAELINSPTFILLNEYLEGRVPLYHLDLYRLQPQEVDALYLETYWDGLEVPLGIVAIEWAERLHTLPESHLEVCLRTPETGGRQVEIRPKGDRAAAWLAALTHQIQGIAAT